VDRAEAARPYEKPFGDRGVPLTRDPFDEAAAVLAGLGPLAFASNQILHLKGACAVGTVLLAQNGRGFVCVRKAQKEAYEFSGLLTLPGGVVRGVECEDSAGPIIKSLADRMDREAGLAFSDLTDLVFAKDIGMPVTAYTVRRRIVRTVILPFSAAVREDFEPRARDASVSECFYRQAPFEWPEFAPANRLLLAAASWKRLDAATRARAAPLLIETIATIDKAAMAVGLPAYVFPGEL